MIKRSTIIETITVLNIILFLYTGIAKIMDYNVFVEQLSDSPILSWAATPVAVFLPIIEFAVVLMLVIPRWRLKALYSCLTLMIIFTVYIVALYTFSKEMPCSCGGIIELLSWKQHLLFNAAFILLDIWAATLLRKERKQWENELSKESELKIFHG